MQFQYETTHSSTIKAILYVTIFTRSHNTHTKNNNVALMTS